MSAVEALSSQSSTPSATLAARDAAHGLYERHSSRILGFCIRRLNTREEAEDAVQTVFVNALRALQRGVVPVSEEAWLFKIAENVCLETHRSNSRRRLREVTEPEDLPDPVVRDPENGRDIARELTAALEDLPPNQRRALLLREWRGLSYKEIATDLRCSVGAVETLIFRARRNVAQALSQTRARIAGVLDLGSLAGALKTVLGGGTAVKIAAAAAVITVAALPAGDAPQVSPGERITVPPPATRSANEVVVSGAQTGERGRAESAVGEKEQAPPGQHEKKKPVTSDTPSESGAGEQPAAQSPVTPPAGSPIQTPNVHVSPPAAVQLPRVPQVPQVPELPNEVQLPELPLPPGLPVQPPDSLELPELP
jgi:RNA polymerase sigma-70 factor (ECF subfamily)